MRIYKLLILFCLAFACRPENPTNEVQNKLHDDPRFATLTLQRGRVVDNVFTSDGSAPQIIYFEYVNVKDKDGEHLEWLPNTQKGQGGFSVNAYNNEDEMVYFLTITYKSSSEDITYQFIEDGQNALHQHFFSVDSSIIRRNKIKYPYKTKNVFKYKYLDTTPWNKNLGEQGVKLTGDTDPIGIKGSFNFILPNCAFVMTIKLMHAYENKYNPLSSYDKPALKYNDMAGWDVKMKVPIKVGN